MNLLTAEHLTKVFTQRRLLDDADFSINEGEKIGVIGINGTGKSTLLRLIAGEEEPDGGTITRGRNLTIRYLPQTPVFDDGATVLDAILKDNVNSINEWSIESEALSAINRLGLPGASEKVAHLSGGQRKRIALANAVLSPVDILILDEPTNHLDSEMAGWLEDYLTDFRGAIVMVTHDRYFLDSIATRIVEVDKGKIYSYPGNYAEYLMLKAERQNIEIASERKRQSLLRTELAWLARGARARSTKQKAHIDRIRAMQAVQAPVEETRIQISSVNSRMGRTTIELDSISKAYGERCLIRDYTYIFLRDDRIGITGPNGCGKSTLLKIINGIISPDSGTVTIGQTIRIGYFSQESEDMDLNLRAIEYIREGAETVENARGEVITAAQMMELFLFDRYAQWVRISELSGGERRRLYLLRILMSAPNVLLLDEPTNDLDIDTLKILENYLDDFQGSVLTVSHDRYFLDRVCDTIFSFTGGGEILVQTGNFTDYMQKHAGRDQDAATNKPSEQKSEKPRQKAVKLSYREQQEYDRIDADMAQMEARLEAIDTEMAGIATDYTRLQALTEEKDALEDTLLEKMERKEYLEDIVRQSKKNQI